LNLVVSNAFVGEFLEGLGGILLNPWVFRRSSQLQHLYTAQVRESIRLALHVLSDMPIIDLFSVAR
jgi:hypothetical protein